MVALKKRRFVGLLAGGLVLASLGLGAWALLRPRVHYIPPLPPVSHPAEEDIPGHPTPEKIGKDGPIIIDFNVPASRVRELKVIFAAIDEAYTNGQYEVARRRLVEAPEDFVTLMGDPYEEVTGPLRRSFHLTFMFLHEREERPLVDFMDVAAFTSYMRLNFELARFFNDAGVKRAHPPEAVYDANMLYQLKRYREKFHTEGKVELARAAEAFYDKWCEQVESKDGYTRRYMWDLMGQYLYTRKRWPDLWKSNREIIQLVRGKAVGLVKLAGYKPKWLDDEFPLPPGASDPCDAVRLGQSGGRFN